MAAAGSTAIDEVKKCLDKALRVTLTDGRVMVGKFACFDKQRNLLLADAMEQRYAAGTDVGDERPKPEKERHLGLILIPRRHVVQVHAIESSDKK